MAGTLARWNPLQDLASLQHEMDRLASGFGLPMRVGTTDVEASVLMPSIDILNRGDDMVIRADIPGVSPDTVDISVTDSMLTLKAERQESHETKDEDYVVRERIYGAFERTLRIPRGVDPSSIHAEFNDGVLEIIVPGGAKATRREAVRVPIQIKSAKKK
jgi:HSP20 family protein